MPTTRPSDTTLRLLACAESFARQEDGAVGHDDWQGLVGILERELALLTRLATEATAPPTDDIAQRTGALRQRYATLSDRIAASQQRDQAELAQIGETTRRIRAVKHAYRAA